MSRTLLLIAHAPSPNTQALLEAIMEGVEEAENLQVILKAPLEAGAQDILACDGLILLTTENIGYMAGLTKDFFDRSYNDLLGKKEGLPVLSLIRAGLDGTGTKRALMSIYTGLGWRTVQEPSVLKGKWNPEFLITAKEAGQAMALGLDAGIF